MPVYLTPLLALLLSFDAIAGERERGSLALLLSYRLTRGELLAGKLAAHLAVLALAMAAGFGLAGLAAAATGGAGPGSVNALFRLIGSSILLGATFLALGYSVSALAGSAASSAAGAIGIWLVFVVLYDLGLLGAVVADDNGYFTQVLFPWLLTLNSGRCIQALERRRVRAGCTRQRHGRGGRRPAPWRAPLAALLLWPVIAFGVARLAIGKIVP